MNDRPEFDLDHPHDAQVRRRSSAIVSPVFRWTFTRVAIGLFENPEGALPRCFAMGEDMIRPMIDEANARLSYFAGPFGDAWGPILEQEISAPFTAKLSEALGVEVRLFVDRDVLTGGSRWIFRRDVRLAPQPRNVISNRISETLGPKP